MRKIKPSLFVILGFALPFISVFFIVGISFAFPNMSEDTIEWSMLIMLLLDVLLPIWSFVFALTLSRARKDNFSKHTIYKYLSPSQICLMTSTVVMLLFVLFGAADMISLSAILMILLVLLWIATILLFAIRLIKNYINKKRKRSTKPRAARTYTPTPSVRVCSRCGAQLPSDQRQVKAINGQSVCDACMQSIMNIEAEKEKALHTKCCICGVDHPRSEMFLADDKFYCQDCFGNKYA